MVPSGPSQDTTVFTERDFSVLVEETLPAILLTESITREPRLDGAGRPDFLARWSDSRVAIIEIRLTTPATDSRLTSLAETMRAYGEAYLQMTGVLPELVLVVAGELTPKRVEQLRDHGIARVIDGTALRAAAPELPWPRDVSDRRQRQGSPIGGGGRHVSLVAELDRTAPGRANWSAYQRLVRDILAATLSPPLQQPLHEHRNASGVNRRDIIFPNYAGEGGWKFLRDHYEAHYVVVDAKNYVGGVKKKDVLQISNYLSAHGAGLFGIIVCRTAADQSAEFTRREQWAFHRKMVIILNDEDLRTMLEVDDPSSVIRQKIEDFRLGF